MREEIRKHPLSVKGKYYVNQDECAWCAACVDTAPNNFALVTDKVELGAYVFKQPETPEEEAQCHEALMCCPHEAIRDDGEE